MEASALKKKKTLVLVCLVFVAFFFLNEVSWSRNNWWPWDAKCKTFHMKSAAN